MPLGREEEEKRYRTLKISPSGVSGRVELSKPKVTEFALGSQMPFFAQYSETLAV